jgi:predicted nucleic acid-binding protein
MRYVLDATFVIDYLRDDPDAVAALDRMMADADELFLTEIVAAEAWAGVRPKDVGRLRTLLNLPEYVQPGPDAAENAGRWRRDARSRGWMLSLTDALIAAAADACDATILTRNERDFALTPVPVESY